MKPIALIDLDGTLADYDTAMKWYQRQLQAPKDLPYSGRYEDGHEPEHFRERRKMIQRMPGFWRELEPIPLGFEVALLLRDLGFGLHILTKGPRSSPYAWGEKVEWCHRHIPGARVTVTEDKFNVDGLVLFDDFPPYFEEWLSHRPLNLVICLPQVWNAEYGAAGAKKDSRVFRYDGGRKEELTKRLITLRDRQGRGT